MISVIIPTLNESCSIAKTLMPLQKWRARGHQVILVDAGSEDDTVEQAKNLVDKSIQSDKGRSIQMNIGAQQADGDFLLFLHADTLIDKSADQSVVGALSSNQWGCFKVRFSSKKLIFKIIAYMMNLRSCTTSVATGDQAIFVQKSLFMKIGGFPDQVLMEDIQLSKNLKALCKMCCLKHEVVTSSRRWEQYGISRTIVLMWVLRLAYFIGVSPAKLKLWYR